MAGSIKTLGDTAFRDYVTDGVPSSGRQEPAKSEIRSFVAAVEAGNGVADLAALKALTIRPSTVAVMAGQAMGLWRWEAGSATTANDGTVVQCTAGDAGRYKRVYTGAIDVTWFGTTGDGVAADTTALQAALNAGGDIVVPAGTYKTGPLTVPVARTRLLCAPGVTFSFPTLGASTSGFDALHDDFAIVGRPKLTGPAAGVYVADETAIRMVAPSGTATMTIATPAVVTWTGHGRSSGEKVRFGTTGALPTGVTAGQDYWITVVDANTFKLSTTYANYLAGTFVATSGSQSGTHTAVRRRSGLVVEAEIENFGSYGVYTRWVDDIRIGGRTFIHDVGYGGAVFLSSDRGVIEPGARAKNITPGTAGNAYGFSLSHISTDYDLDAGAGTKAAVNHFCADWTIEGVQVEDCLWAGIDAHGAYGTKVRGGRVYNCKHGIHVAGSSGDADAYGGWDNEISGCIVDSRRADGTAGSWANAGIGINCSVSNATAVVKHQRVKVLDNVVYGYGIVSNSGGTPSIGADNCADIEIIRNTIESWGGVAASHEKSTDVLFGGNVFKQLADGGDTSGVCMKSATSDALRVSAIGNIVSANDGTAARVGFYSRSTRRARLEGNDFIACTASQLDLGTVGFFAGGDGVPAKVMDLGSGGGSTTLDLSEFAYGSKDILVYMTAGAAIAVTNITGVPAWTRVTLCVQPGSSNITFNRTTAVLDGSADWVGGPYDTLSLICFAVSGGIQWAELGRAANG